MQIVHVAVSLLLRVSNGYTFVVAPSDVYDLHISRRGILSTGVLSRFAAGRIEPDPGMNMPVVPTN